MNITQVQARCKAKPHGTNPDEYDEVFACFHWDLGDMIMGAEFIQEVNGEDILWRIGTEYYLWVNRERNYSMVDGETLELI